MRLLVTRPLEQAGELAGRLRAAGYEVALCPLIAIEPTGPETVELNGYDWVLLTSANAARELGRRGRGTPRRIAAIGPGTAAALRGAGREPDLVAAVSTQEGLLAELPQPAGRVLFAGAEDARRLLVEALDADFVALYRTRSLTPPAVPAADLVLLASASAARAYGAIAADIPAVSIGPHTTAVARAAGVDVVAEATRHDNEGLVAAVDRAAAAVR